MSRRKRIALAVALIAALLVVGVALAAQVTVDDFTSTDQNAHVFGSPLIKSTCDSQTGVTSALGNTREVTITKYNGLGGSATADMIVDTFGVPPKLAFATASTINATGEAIWDGASNGCSLDPTGLGGVDLTGGGTNDGILAQVLFDDLPGVTMTFKAYNGANWSQVSASLPGGILNGDKVDFFFPFSSFTTMGGTGIGDFTSVGALVVGIDNRGNGAGADVDLSLIQAISIRDYGDLPDSYSTTAASNGARHLTATGLRLGSNVDAETDAANPGPSANGDNNDGFPNDEDGVSRVLADFWTPNATVHLNVTVNGCTGNCSLNAWMDWNNNGNFTDAGEQVYSDNAISNGTGQILALTIPGSYVTGTSVAARFRLCSATGQCNTFNGQAPDGEVEDYVWPFGPTAVELSSLKAQPTTSPVLPMVLVGATTVVLIGVVFFIRRKKTT